MKKIIFLIVATVLSGIATASATCWRINPDPKAKAKFISVEQAMNDNLVADGDTLILDPGAYGNIELTKENITVIGPGYFLDQKEGWYEKDMAIINIATLSTCSTIEGCAANTIIPGNNSTIRRCKVGIIHNNADFTNYLVEQCFVTTYINFNDYSKLRNNIVLGYIHGDGNDDGVVIENNTIINNNSKNCLSTGILTNSIVRNNIIIDALRPEEEGHIYTCTGPDVAIYNNVTNNYIVQEYVYDNVIDAKVESLFLNDGSADGRWQLSENSVAKGAGANGEDCGAFAGNTPYVLSGLPRFIPHITKVEVPSRPTNGKLNIKIKIENQDE